MSKLKKRTDNASALRQGPCLLTNTWCCWDQTCDFLLAMSNLPAHLLSGGISHNNGNFWGQQKEMFLSFMHCNLHLSGAKTPASSSFISKSNKTACIIPNMQWILSETWDAGMVRGRGRRERTYGGDTGRTWTNTWLQLTSLCSIIKSV